MLCLNVRWQIGDKEFSTKGDKALGSDDIQLIFFRESWIIVQDDALRTIDYFFTLGKLWSKVGSTIITLIPKSAKSL